jgi:AraC-like DNA-binding protein
MSIMQSVLRSSRFEVFSHVCRHPRVDCGYSPGGEPARFIFTRRGAFGVHAEGRSCMARPGQAVLLRKGVEYRITHPDRDGCDCCLDVRLDDAVLDELGVAGRAGPACVAFGHDLAFQKSHVELLLGLRRGVRGDEAEATLLDLFDRLLQVRQPWRPRPAAQLARRVARVEEAILGRLGENLDLGELAALAGCSPFHLCRTFRAVTGQSLRQFRLQQRLGAALGRLGDGEDDLAALACDVGFYSHSHMTGAFRRVLGMSPRQLREDLRRSDLRRLRARLRAAPGRMRAPH